MIALKISNLLLFAAIFPILCGCLTSTELNLEFKSYEPREIGDAHSISTPAQENVDAIALTKIYEDVYDNENLWSLRSLLVFRNGNLIAEAYLKDEKDINQKHIVWSCTKQVMGILTGIAIDNGLFEDVDDPISQYFDQELINHDDKGVISIRNLLTMRSGIDYSNDIETDQILQQIPENSVDFILNRPLNASQGVEFHYNDGNPHLLSALIEKMVDKPTDEWAHDVLFSKVEITNYNWVRYRDGVTLGGFGIETTPRELSKIALCIEDSGRWKGEQVVSPEWIENMIAPQVQIENFEYSFGYYWWIDEIRNLYFMWGVGGQFAFIVPEKNLVIVMTSFPNTKGEYEIQANEALPIVDRIVEASF